MNVPKKLARLAEIDGFIGAALFTPEGKLLVKHERSESRVEAAGILANNALVNAQKATLEMGYGRGEFLFIHAEKAMILIRCLNEGGNPLVSEPGKTHIHLVLVVAKDGSLGLARLEINKVIASLAEDFRDLVTAEAPPLAEAPAALAAPTAASPSPQSAVRVAAKHDLKGVADSLDHEEIGNVLDSLLD